MTSREDLYLKKLNDNSVVTPQPVTQREKILSELAGVNGLGVELPTVTDTDNGKALVVDNGQWALGNVSGGSGGSSGSLNIIVNMTPQGQAQSGAPIYDFTTDTKWSELVDAYRNDLEIRLTAKQPIDENSNDTRNTVARFAWFMPSYNGSTPSSDIDKGTFYFNSIGYISSNGDTLTAFTVNSFGLSKSSNDEIHFAYSSSYKTF